MPIRYTAATDTVSGDMCCGPKAAELSAASTWCRQYAVVNATGLRKIAKKHDKRCGGTAGSQFLQRCWDCGHLSAAASADVAP